MNQLITKTKPVYVFLGVLLVSISVFCTKVSSGEVMAVNQSMPGGWMVYGWVLIDPSSADRGEAFLTVQRVLGGEIPQDTVVRVNDTAIEKISPGSGQQSYKGKVPVKPGEAVDISVASRSNNLSIRSTTAYDGLGSDVKKIFVNTGIFSSPLGEETEGMTLDDAVKLGVLEEKIIMGGLRARTYNHAQITHPGTIVMRALEQPGSYFVAVIIDDAEGNPIEKWACSVPSSPSCFPYSHPVPPSAKVTTVISKGLEVEVFYHKSGN